MSILQSLQRNRLTTLAYQDEHQIAWDKYVFQHPEGTLFHTTRWKRVIEREFGFKAVYLLAEDEGEIRGVLPMFLSSNWVQGRTLISTPFAVYGGICASDEAARLTLRETACRIAEEQDVNYLELREAHRPFGEGFQTKELYVTFEGQLNSDPEKVMAGFPKGTRYMIRKGQKNGLRSVNDDTQLDTFYELYARSVWNLGTPVFSKRFFKILREELGDAGSITIILHEREPVAAAFSITYRDSTTPYYVGSLPESKQFAPNNFMFWELIRMSCERGLQKFDFGRSKVGTGSHFFKTKWNMIERPLPYQFYLVKRKSLPNFSPANPRLKVATEMWKKIPFPLTKALGPPLVRLFP